MLRVLLDVARGGITHFRGHLLPGGRLGVDLGAHTRSSSEPRGVPRPPRVAVRAVQEPCEHGHAALSGASEALRGVPDGHLDEAVVLDPLGGALSARAADLHGHEGSAEPMRAILRKALGPITFSFARSPCPCLY